MDTNGILNKITENKILLPQICVNAAIEELTDFMEKYSGYEDELSKVLTLIQMVSDLLAKENYDFTKEMEGLVDELKKQNQSDIPDEPEYLN